MAILFKSYILAQRALLPNEKNLVYMTRFRAVECQNHQNQTAYFTFCYVKSYSRNTSTLNFGIQVVKPLEIYFRLIANYRYGLIYREILDSKLVDYCQLMKNVGTNPIIKFMIDSIKKSVPKLFHACPYEGLMEFRNLTIEDDVIKKLQIFPEGQYKYNVSIYDTPKQLVMVIVVFTEVKSPLKNSFGKR